MIEFTVPGTMSANRYWRHRVIAGRPAMYLSTEAKEYKRAVARAARAAGVEAPIADWVTIDLILHPVEPQDVPARMRKYGAAWHLRCRSIDVDNAVKVTLDAMESIVYLDDAQVAAVSIRRGYPMPGGGLTVKVDTPPIEKLARAA
jgi:crossover junction endodeoxyribonuclease RusA